MMNTYKTITAKGPMRSESLSNVNTRLNSSYPNKVVGLIEIDGGQVIAGQRALGKINQLQNNGAVKKIINGYISKNQQRSNVPSYKRKEFVPFVEERDHLGQLIDSEIRTELGSNSYVKKNLVKKPRKHNDKLEIRDDIPRRWLEGGTNTEYQQSTGRVSIDGMPLTYSNYGGVRTSEQFGKTLYSPMNEGHGFNSDLDSNVQSFDKTKRNYKTLVAAAKNLKLPNGEVDGDRSVQDNQTMLDTQASEKGFATAFRGGKNAGLRDINSSNAQRPALLTKTPGVKPATADNNKRSSTRNRNLKQMTQSQPYGKQGELNSHFSQQTQAFSQSMGLTLDQKPEFISQSHGQQILMGADEKASTQSLIDKNVSEILRDSTQLVNLKFNHLMVDHNNQTMKKLGLLSGTKHAIEAGITTQTETLLGGGAKTNPHLRLNNKEEEYVLSQLMQKNYDIRNSQAVFKSKTGRSKIDGNKQFMVPPVGLYEHQFNRGATHDAGCKKVALPVNMSTETPVNQVIGGDKAEVDMKYINKPHEKKAKTQAFSCFAETRQIDFTKSQTRDEVSFYKKLARIDKAKTLRMDVKEYEKLIRMQKSGRFVIKFNHQKQEKKGNEKLKKGENEQTQTSQSQIDSVL